MTERTFQVLEGGLARCPSPKYKEIRSCWVTNTRLMGVLVVCVEWKPETLFGDHLHQFFYFDYEEYGLDRYETYEGRDHKARTRLEQDFIAGLGGDKVYILPREAVFLIQSFLRDNRSRGIEMPGKEKEYLFFLDMNGQLSAEEERALWQKTCVPLQGENGLANYFLMRCFGRDFAGAALLAEEGVETDLFPEFPAGTFYRNQVTLSVEHSSCQCRSLVETEGLFFLVMTELDFRNMKVSGYRRVSEMALSEAEAYMSLSHTEYVTLFTFHGGLEDFERSGILPADRTVANQEHGGKTFLLYNRNNNHVEKSTYWLREDLQVAIHVGNGQILVCAASLGEIRELEKRLQRAEIFRQVDHVWSYKFLDPVFMGYLDSEHYDFASYLESIKIH